LAEIPNHGVGPCESVIRSWLVFKFTKVEDCSRVHATAKPQSDVNRKWIFFGIIDPEKYGLAESPILTGRTLDSVG
jgi:hypothetical protein